jgi:hypothetical protein
MGHVTLGGFDQVRDEVITALQLNVHLSERVPEAVPQPDERVIDTHAPKANDDEAGEN